MDMSHFASKPLTLQITTAWFDDSPHVLLSWGSSNKYWLLKYLRILFDDLQIFQESGKLLCEEDSPILEFSEELHTC